MKEHHLQTSRTARYFTIGNLNDSTENVWIVLHGYAQLAADFIKTFEVLDNGKNFIVAPEGLNRFYTGKAPRRVVSTWMTSEDRLNEIQDYILYLDNLYQHLNLHQSKAKIYLLGFSQGVATASRWLHATQNRVDHFVDYAGEMGTELYNPFSKKIRNTPMTYVTGKNDPLISLDEHLKVYEMMKSLNANIIEFDGGHEVRTDVVERIAALLISTDNKNSIQ